MLLVPVVFDDTAEPIALQILVRRLPLPATAPPWRLLQAPLDAAGGGTGQVAFGHETLDHGHHAARMALALHEAAGVLRVGVKTNERFPELDRLTPRGSA